MSWQTRVTCDHLGCVATIDVSWRVVTDVIKAMVDRGWYNTVRVVDGKPARCDLCPAHRIARSA